MKSALTNRQIAESDKKLLTSIDRQIRYIMDIEMQRKPCPNCGELHNLPEAAGVDVDEFDFGNHGSDRVGKCRKCNRTLIFVLPIMGGWHWRLDTAEATT